MRKLAVLVTMVGALSVAQVAKAATVLELKISDSAGNSITIFDNNSTAASSTGTASVASGGDTNGAAGILLGSGSVGTWTVASCTCEGAPFLGQGTLDMSFSATPASGTTTSLTFQLTETGLTSVPANFTFGVGGTTIAGANVTYTVTDDPGNAAFGTTNPVGTTGVIPIGPFNVYGAGGTGPFGTGTVSGSGYSLTQTIFIHAPSSASGTNAVSGDANLTPTGVPEPASLALLGTGLVGLVGGIRRRMARR